MQYAYLYSHMSLSLEFAGEQLSNKFWFEFFELSNKLLFNQADMGRYVKLSNIRKSHWRYQLNNLG